MERTNVPVVSWVLLCCSWCPPYGLSEHPEFQTGVQICPWGLKSEKKKWLRHCFITCYQMIWYNFMCKWHSCLFQIHTLQSGIHAFHHSSHRFCDLRDKTPWLIRKPKWQETSCNWFFFFFGLLQHAVTQYSIYLVHRNCSLDPCCHGFYPGAHPQVVHRLVLLSDGVLCMDPCHFHVPLLDSLEAAQSGSVKIFGGQHQPVGFNHVLLSESATYFLDFRLLYFFFFITFLGISLEVFGSKL